MTVGQGHAEIVVFLASWCPACQAELPYGEGWAGPVLVDDADGSVAAAYGLSGTPFTVAVRDGEVVARVAGQVRMDAMSQLAAAVAADR